LQSRQNARRTGTMWTAMKSRFKTRTLASRAEGETALMKLPFCCVSGLTSDCEEQTCSRSSYRGLRKATSSVLELSYQARSAFRNNRVTGKLGLHENCMGKIVWRFCPVMRKSKKVGGSISSEDVCVDYP
jgi:hypothetical protein